MQYEQDRYDLPYRVGGLLYTPALNKSISKKILAHELKCLTSIVFCLEDSISDEALPHAEQQLKETLSALAQGGETLPLLFVRIRSEEHLKKIHEALGETESILTGYVLPKFDLSNCGGYCRTIRAFNHGRARRLYMMPILESKTVADIGNRVQTLLAIKKELDACREYVLNVRVGGNDFSNMYGLRRSESQTIYEIGVIRDILANIMNVFGSDYVVSGPVWEYFGEDEAQPWAAGLRRELELDRLNGFIGKTAIHPSQLPVIYDSLKVPRCDYEDALRIADRSGSASAVEKSWGENRMNEVKCHSRWASRIMSLTEIYGIREG